LAVVSVRPPPVVRRPLEVIRERDESVALVAQDAVRLLDLLELFLRAVVLARDVRVVPEAQAAERALQRLLVRGFLGRVRGGRIVFFVCSEVVGTKRSGAGDMKDARKT
jgi:hypothetical protein